MRDKANRRQFVKGSAGIAAGALIAGCSGDGDGGGNGNGNGGGNGDGNGGGNGNGNGGGNGGSDDYPSGNLEYIVPFGQGGGTDTWARQLMPVMGDELGVNIRIENIEGSDSLRGTAELYNSEPDGSTFGGFNPPSTPSTYLIHEDDMDFDITDFEGIGLYSATGGIIIANKDVAEEHGIENPGDVLDVYESGEITTIGSRLKGSYYHIRAILLKQRGVQWEDYVGYDGNGALVQAVASGEVPIGLASDTSAKSAVDSGTVEVVGSLYSEGTPVFPEVDPITDHGMEEMDFLGRSARAMWLPPETPENIVTTLTEALESALETDEMQEWSEETGNPIMYEGPDSANQLLERQISQIKENVDLEAIREAAGQQ